VNLQIKKALLAMDISAKVGLGFLKNFGLKFDLVRENFQPFLNLIGTKSLHPKASIWYLPFP